VSIGPRLAVDSPAASYPTHAAVPTWEERWRELVLGQLAGPGAAVLRGGLWALSGLYGGTIRTYRAAYDLGLLRTVTADCRVVSVGNLTVGGTGKSTTVLWLARYFHSMRVRVAVLSYGYRADSAQPVTVVSDGERILVPASASGDEPRMLAEALPGVPVLIGKRRQLAAAEAVRAFGTQVCILDDALQYWRLAKDLEIALVDARCPFGGGHLLPRGLLREPVRALRRAHVVITTNCHEVPEPQRAALREQLQALSPAAHLAQAHHSAAGFRALLPTGSTGGTPSPGGSAPLAGLRVLALSSLGNPGGFERMLSEMGADVVPARYPDHHRYRSHELESEIGRARTEGCAAIVTTEKDAVKIDPSWARSLPVWVLAVELAFDLGREGLEERLKRLVP
jgi:tetraacyldisaccharide-1-P 4'-kinase